MPENDYVKFLLSQLKALLKAYNCARSPAEKSFLACRIREVLADLEGNLPVCEAPTAPVLPPVLPPPVDPCLDITLPELCAQVQEIKAFLRKLDSCKYKKFFTPQPVMNGTEGLKEILKASKKSKKPKKHA